MRHQCDSCKKPVAEVGKVLGHILTKTGHYYKLSRSYKKYPTNRIWLCKNCAPARIIGRY